MSPIAKFSHNTISCRIAVQFLPAWRYNSADTSYVSVSVCLSQVGVLSNRINESRWFWARELPSTFPILCYGEIQVSPKIKVLPSGTLSQTPVLENFASECRALKRVVDLARQGGRSERDKLDCCRSNKLAIPSNSDLGACLCTMLASSFFLQSCFVFYVFFRVFKNVSCRFSYCCAVVFYEWHCVINRLTLLYWSIQLYSCQCVQ